jgi:hypothetical protein
MRVCIERSGVSAARSEKDVKNAAAVTILFMRRVMYIVLN